MKTSPLSVLVTGSSGFIGHHVVQKLHEEGHRVMAIDMIPPTQPLPGGVRFYHCDIRQGILPNKRFDAIVHLAALAGVRPSIERAIDYEITNVVGTLRLLEHCRQFGTPFVIFASSSSVYGPDAPLPFREDGPTTPCSPYALTKLHCEQWGALYARLHGLRFLALRFFSVWGPGQRPDLALEAFRRNIEAGKPVTIHGDGQHRRDLTHVSDVARAIALALLWEGSQPTVLNVGTGKNHSGLDMLAAATEVAATLRFSPSNFTHLTPPAVHQNAHPADLQETLASLMAVGKELGWSPTVFFPKSPNSTVKKV